MYWLDLQAFEITTSQPTTPEWLGPFKQHDEATHELQRFLAYRPAEGTRQVREWGHGWLLTWEDMGQHLKIQVSQDHQLIYRRKSLRRQPFRRRAFWQAENMIARAIGLPAHFVNALQHEAIFSSAQDKPHG